jgi:hypothetical protein
MSLIADFLTNNPANGAGKFQVRAGALLALNDGIQLGVDGKGYPIKTTDYSVVTNCTPGTPITSTATGQIVAETTLGGTAPLAIHRQAVALDSDGSIFAVGTNSTTNGVKVYKYSPTGALLKSAVVDTTASLTNCVSIGILSNGNIVVAYIVGQDPAPAKFAILTPNLQPVVAATLIGNAAGSGLGFSYGWQLSNLVTLDNGGFAVCYQAAAPVTSQMLSIYDNAGAAVYNAAVKTWTGVTNPVYTRIAKLSDGNIVIACRSMFTTSAGMWHGIFSPVGAPVLAMALINAGVVTNNAMISISVGANFYSLARYENGNVVAYVYSNAGALQGAPFTAATTTPANSNQIKLLWDGTQFLFLWQNSNGSLMQFTKLPTAGAGYTTYDITATTSQYNSYIDAFYENGIIVGVSQGVGAARPFVWSVYVETGTLVADAVNLFGSTPTTLGSTHAVIAGGDFSFICLYDYGSTAALNLFVGKYGNTSIIGAALAAAGVNTLVSVGQGTGAYAINQLRGSPSRSFDHTSGANIYGNKGAILRNGLVLRGM